MKSTPLVSCIMPTYNRRHFVSQSILYFLRQDYPTRELIIVDDGSNAVADLVPDDKRIRYVRLDSKHSVGAKRNLACQVSRGELIAHWDDDDWYASNRLSLQVRELLSSNKQACGMSSMIFYDLMAGKVWRYRHPTNRRPWLAGSTLLYRRSAWAVHRFPDRNVGEDTAFVRQFASNHLHRITSSSFAVAIIHQGNTAAKRLKGPRWQQCPLSKVTQLLASERDFYVALRNGDPLPRPNFAAYLFRQQGVKPLVSCILATKDRRVFLRQAIKYFQRQSYPNKELIILDSSRESVRDLVPNDKRIRYMRVEPGTSLGRKLNLGISQSQGEIIQKLDDDDYYHPEFLSTTVNTLIRHDPDRTIVGLNSILVLIAATGELKEHSGHARWCAGGTLAFFKQLWAKRPFRNLSFGEDTFFLEDHHTAQLVKIRDPKLYILVRHEHGHTWNKTMNGKLGITEFFSRRSNYAKSLKECLASEEDWAFYQSLNLNTVTVVVSAYRLSKEKINRFIQWNEKVFKENSVDLVVITDRPCDLKYGKNIIYPRNQTKFSLSRVCNYGIKRAKGIVIKTDIDIIFSKSIIQNIKRNVQTKKAFVGICANIDVLSEIKYKPWHKFKKRTGGFGACFAMTRYDWGLLHGYNEKMWGWGYEDDDMLRRAKGKIKVNVSSEFPLFHLNHELRKFEDEKTFYPIRRAKNLQIIGWYDEKWGEGKYDLPLLSASSLEKAHVTVSIPYFQCKTYIRRAVESILAQTHTNLTVVVVNDGDKTPPWDELADITDPRLIRFDLPANRGRYFADAVVLNATSSPYLLIQDADDWSAPQRVATLLRIIDQADAAISAVQRHKLVDGRLRATSTETYPRVYQPLSAKHDYRACHHALFKTEALRKIGGYYGGFRIGYDKLIMNFLLMTGRVSYVDQPLYHYVKRPRSLTSHKATGFGSATRNQVDEQLDQVYHAAYDSYIRYRSGEIELASLLKFIRQMIHQRVIPAERDELMRHSNRLRSILSHSAKN